MQDKVFIFSKEEFMILAAVSRIRQMYGFSLREDIEEQEVFRMVLGARALQKIEINKTSFLQLLKHVLPGKA